jgi:catechol 2,3-dioxygenase-like lactoylglutathione lyase family enzyme
MLDHISVYVKDYAAAKTFYAAALQPLGYSLQMEFTEWGVGGFGEAGKPDFWISTREQDHNAHVAFLATSAEMVNAFYKAALAAGGKDNGAPGYRPDYSPGYYGAFIIDPSGNNIEAVYHDPNPPQAAVSAATEGDTIINA